MYKDAGRTKLHNEIVVSTFQGAVELALDPKCLPGVTVVRSGAAESLHIDDVREERMLPQGWTPESGAVNSVRTIHVNGDNHWVEMPIGCWCPCVGSYTHSIEVTKGPNLYVKDLKIMANRNKDAGSRLLFYAESPCQLMFENVKVLAPADSVAQCVPCGNVLYNDFKVREFSQLESCRCCGQGPQPCIGH